MRDVFYYLYLLFQKRGDNIILKTVEPPKFNKHKKSNFATYSNTPQSVKNFYNSTLEKTNICEIKIDWITITGTFLAKSNEEILKANGWEKTKNDSHGIPSKYHLYDQHHDSLAILTRNRYNHEQEKNHSWSLRTSNHLTSSEKEKILNIACLFKSSHVTRIDVAIDFINFNAPSSMAYEFRNTRKKICPVIQDGKVQTIMAGKGKTLEKYRYYDKIKERKENNKSIPTYIKTWERLEIELHGSKANIWEQATSNMLDHYKLKSVYASRAPVVIPPSSYTNTERAFIIALQIDENLYAGLPRPTKSKYTKLIQQVKDERNNLPDRTKIAKETLKKNVPFLQKEIETFLY